jgi:hypothetical protein
MAESLFDTVYSGYSAPLQAQLTKADIAYKQIATQTAQQELKNQVAMQDSLQQIWGPNGTLAANSAIDNPTDADAQRLSATAHLMFQTGHASEGVGIMNSMSLAQARQQTASNQQAKAVAARNVAVGGALGAATDQSSYSAALSTIQNDYGVDIEKYGLTGDYATDQPKIQAIVQGSMTANQQIKAAETHAAHQATNDYRNARLGQFGTALSIQQDKLSLEQQRNTLNEANVHHKWQEDAFRDQRAQEGLDFRKLKDVDRQIANVQKVQPVEMKAAQNIMATDDRTMNIPENLRNGLSQMAVLRTKRYLANQLRNAPAGTAYQQEDFDSALEQTMQEMDQEGLFKPSKLGGTGLFGTGQAEYNHIPPKTNRPQGAQGQGQPTPSPAVNKPVPSNPTSPAELAKYSSVVDVKAAMQRKEITYDQAAAILRAKGWAK